MDSDSITCCRAKKNILAKTEVFEFYLLGILFLQKLNNYFVKQTKGTLCYLHE